MAAKAVSSGARPERQKGRFKAFFKGVWAELKKVYWPARKKVIIYTGVVIITVVVVSAILSVFDLGLSSVMKLIIE